MCILIQFFLILIYVDTCMYILYKLYAYNILFKNRDCYVLLIVRIILFVNASINNCSRHNLHLLQYFKT